jgi:hypothetical protein
MLEGSIACVGDSTTWLKMVKYKQAVRAWNALQWGNMHTSRAFYIFLIQHKRYIVLAVSWTVAVYSDTPWYRITMR